MRSVSVWVVAVLGILLLNTMVLAASNDLGLDPKIRYDVYLGNNGANTTVIKDVQIIGLRDVGQKVFVVVYTDDFAGKRSEGLLALDSIQAVLPSFRSSPPSGSLQIQTR